MTVELPTRGPRHQQGRRSEEIQAFWDRLENTGSFRRIQWSNVDISEDGLHRIQMNAVYVEGPPAPRPASTPREVSR